MKKFYVFGHPVEHSLSPRIHAMFGEQCRIELDYRTYDIEPGGFIECVGRLRREESPAGANVTVPFKQDAADYCTQLTERARAACAVNTMTFDGDRVYGDNTDGVGFLHDLTQRCGVAVRGKRILIVGAGGAARGVLSALKGEGCASITIANRTLERAVALAKEMGVASAAFTDLGTGFDVVVNATSAGLSNAAPAVPGTIFKGIEVAYDLFYAKNPTPFMRLAAESGAPRVEDGLGMLVEQAAESFKVWFGARPDTRAVYAALRG